MKRSTYCLAPVLMGLAMGAQGAEPLLQLRGAVLAADIQASAPPLLKALAQDATVSQLYMADVHAAALADSTPRLELALEKGVSIDLTRVKARHTREGMLVWTGEQPSDRLKRFGPREVAADLQNQAILVRHGDNLTGSVRLSGQLYQIWPVGQGKHVVAKVNEQEAAKREEAEPDEVSAPPEAQAPAEVSAPRATEHSRINVMVVTTRQARARWPDYPAIIQLAFEEANEGAANSRVAITFDYAGTMDADYDEGTYTQSQILSQMQGSSAELGAAVRLVRDQWHADLVSLMSVNSTGGTAYNDATKATAYSVVNGGNMVGRYTFAHEMAHNLGGSHDLEQYTQPKTPNYRHAYKVPGHFSTIVSYSCNPACPRVNAFSNPNLTYQGVAMGTQAFEDNARRLNERRELVANFYP